MLKTALYRCCAIVLLLPVCAVSQQEPQPLPVMANDFVQQILSRSGSPSAVAVTFQNIASISQEAQEAAQNAILNAFRAANIRVVKPEQAIAEVQIAFSEDWQGSVWIATVQQGSSSQQVIRKMPRPQRISSSHAPTLTLRKVPVWQQETQILDFYADNQNLLVLEPSQLALYASDSGQWRPRQTLAIPHQHPWPRDLRGRLEVHGGHIDAFLPGTRCTGALSPPALDCRASDDPWPVDSGLVAFFSPRRNFFTGLIAGQGAGASVSPFFSGAAWQNGDQRMWLFTGTDGRARLFQNDLGSPAAIYSGWGSTMAAVHSTCGSGWQLLVSSPADNTRVDSVQAVEIAGRDAQPMSAPVEFPGAVEALWTAGNYSQVVNGVVQSQATGKYEAFTLTAICNQ
ncbi:MAG TPA: hypothetical protein VFR84_05410 [Candidatus Angelobacter sp.]|nr:hypothetical protein [Candidatus Angelobacter sp.]